MSDAAAPGPSSGEPDDDAERGAPEGEAPAVPTGEPDDALVDEVAETASSGAVGGPATADDPPEPTTGLPDDDTVTEAVESTAAPAVEPTEAPDTVVGLERVAAGIDGARAEIAEVRAGVESMLPDLAATAREETLALAAREETVAAGNARIQKSLDEMVRLTRRADDHVAELHAENQRLRAGELATATLPMLRDLVRLHDEVARLGEASHPDARADLDLVGSRLLDTLARWGLTPFTAAVGDPLDAHRHQGVGRVPSSDGEPGTVATVRRPGFAHDDGRTFRPADVEVFAPPAPPEET